jgi:hypothetical protein
MEGYKNEYRETCLGKVVAIAILDPPISRTR